MAGIFPLDKQAGRLSVCVCVSAALRDVIVTLYLHSLPGFVFPSKNGDH